MLRNWKTFSSWQNSKKSKNDRDVLSKDPGTQISAQDTEPQGQGF